MSLIKWIGITGAALGVGYLVKHYEDTVATHAASAAAAAAQDAGKLQGKIITFFPAFLPTTAEHLKEIALHPLKMLGVHAAPPPASAYAPGYAPVAQETPAQQPAAVIVAKPIGKTPVPTQPANPGTTDPGYSHPELAPQPPPSPTAATIPDPALPDPFLFPDDPFSEDDGLLADDAYFAASDSQGDIYFQAMSLTLGGRGAAPEEKPKQATVTQGGTVKILDAVFEEEPNPQDLLSEE